MAIKPAATSTPVAAKPAAKRTGPVRKTAASTKPAEYDGEKAIAFMNMAIPRADGSVMKINKGKPLYASEAQDAGITKWAKANPGKTLTITCTIHVIGEETVVDTNFDLGEVPKKKKKKKNKTATL